MKNYAVNDVSGRDRLAIPAGGTFPRAPLIGELFFLSCDMPADTNPLLPWYSRGTYAFGGVVWEKLSDVPRARKVGIIGAREVENEVPVKLGTPPSLREGTEIVTVAVRPTNRRATFSGTATMWLNTRSAGTVWVAVFNKLKLCALAAQYVEPDKSASLNVSFYDAPSTHEEQTYSLRVYSDVKNVFFINRGDLAHFDGVAQTAFIVEENT